ncbi:MAG: hypothetical protein MI740_18190 [Halanaerobiales bacterium]|nr:hypothetical protein [Halanaerobiales bacterium]
MDKKFDNKSNTIFGNIFLIGLIIFTLMIFALFYSSTGPIYEKLFMLLNLFLFYVFFTRFTSRVEFTADLCIVTTPPFFKHKHEISGMTFINFKGLYFIKFSEPYYKIPFYMITLDNQENEKLVKYVKAREDIKKKII